MIRMKRSRLPSWFHRKRRQGFKWWVFNNGEPQSKYGRPLSKSIRRANHLSKPTAMIQSMRSYLFNSSDHAFYNPTVLPDP